MKDRDIPARDASLSHASSLRATLRMYGFDYCRGTKLEIFCFGMSADDLTAHSAGCKTVG